MKQLAIVIPAYKIDFFRATLDSLAAQTCKDFTVYVGDDCSPSDFRSLIEEYKDKLDIRYTKFDANLGGRDLVAQWTRCIELTEGEPWLWLFSDDDVMGEMCVEAFYKEIEACAKYDIYHFDVDVIDEKGDILKKAKAFPPIIDSKSFFLAKGNGSLDCFVVEFVFSRGIYDQVRGFQSFDLAWGSDVATWIKMGDARGIKTINDAKVLWRSSCLNITPNNNNGMAYRKLMIFIDYLSWSKNFFDNSFWVSKYVQILLFKRSAMYVSVLSRKDLDKTLAVAVEKNIISAITKTTYMSILPIVKLVRRK